MIGPSTDAPVPRPVHSAIAPVSFLPRQSAVIIDSVVG